MAGECRPRSARRRIRLLDSGLSISSSAGGFSLPLSTSLPGVGWDEKRISQTKTDGGDQNLWFAECPFGELSSLTPTAHNSTARARGCASIIAASSLGQLADIEARWLGGLLYRHVEGKR